MKFLVGRDLTSRNFPIFGFRTGGLVFFLPKVYFRSYLCNYTVFIKSLTYVRSIYYVYDNPCNNLFNWRSIKEVPYRVDFNFFPIEFVPRDFTKKTACYPEWTLKLNFSAVVASCNLSSVPYERAASALNPLLFHPLRDHPCAKFFGRTFLGCPLWRNVFGGE